MTEEIESSKDVFSAGTARKVVAVPYVADPKDLPSRLPTKEEIESSKDVFSEATDRKVVGVGQHFVVKYGRMVDPIEGQTILFVQRNTSVPVPRIYAIYNDISDCKIYIVMERITGESLETLWPKMSEAERRIISEKLRESVDQLRGLSSPGSYCSLGNRGLLDDLFWTGNSTGSRSIECLFGTEDELNAAMLKKYLSSTGLPGRASLYERAFRQFFCDHPPTFTHGDFQRKNIIVRADGQALEDIEVVLIDWKYSGWYPSYWEYAMALIPNSKWDNDWDRWIAMILDEYLLEWSWMKIYVYDLFS
ncbi:unnamed protein product [Calypogeia fissa]